MFGIGVKFYNKNTKEWSKSYTYLYDKPLMTDTKVIVEVDDWYSIGKVTGFKSDFKPLPGINYKEIKGVANELFV